MTAQAMSWKPIDSAPRDGRDVIVGYESARVWIVRSAWYRSRDIVEKPTNTFDESDIGWWSYRNSVTQEMITPTHWLCVVPEHQN